MNLHFDVEEYKCKKIANLNAFFNCLATKAKFVTFSLCCIALSVDVVSGSVVFLLWSFTVMNMDKKASFITTPTGTNTSPQAFKWELFLCSKNI